MSRSVCITFVLPPVSRHSSSLRASRETLYTLPCYGHYSVILRSSDPLGSLQFNTVRNAPGFVMGTLPLNRPLQGFAFVNCRSRLDRQCAGSR
ncbi:hypothetical protein NEOLEDRAFT_193916 [Neolentinus lepideus HHB14362 ss-1]|uniref:Uncharacterized protein n=1 Tax=Neolentinus lepideus HHB14362 ss-1 TaxID=1314782 RepID=A0A165MFG3_9AGAM|nr:hypothetical protein NEOLEDRAFT_193916 [Neolentinus lepideus HHB14362 ss-1]